MMETILIPQPDVIPASWGWFQFFLLVTFPLHLLAMNAMLGGLVIGILQHLHGGDVQRQLAKRIAIALPLVIAFTVNFGVAPLLFLQVLYGQFVYTSSILMGAFWIMVIPLLIIGYYGAYLYDFKFTWLGKAGPVVAIVTCLLMVVIGFLFVNNMQLMALPELFRDYFSNRHGTMTATGQPGFWARFVHMMMGAVAVGGLFVALLGQFGKNTDAKLLNHARSIGMRIFFLVTCGNVMVGAWYLVSLPREQMMLFMGNDVAATAVFVLSLFLAAGAIWSAAKNKLPASIGHMIALVVAMTCMRSWLRSSYLHDVFTLDQLQVVPQYSPLFFFLAILAGGIAALVWLVITTRDALQRESA